MHALSAELQVVHWESVQRVQLLLRRVLPRGWLVQALRRTVPGLLLRDHLLDLQTQVRAAVRLELLWELLP